MMLMIGITLWLFSFGWFWEAVVPRRVVLSGHEWNYYITVSSCAFVLGTIFIIAWVWKS